jgi:hypothetical protein
MGSHKKYKYRKHNKNCIEILVQKFVESLMFVFIFVVTLTGVYITLDHTWPKLG